MEDAEEQDSKIEREDELVVLDRNHLLQFLPPEVF